MATDEETIRLILELVDKLSAGANAGAAGLQSVQEGSEAASEGLEQVEESAQQAGDALKKTGLEANEVSEKASQAGSAGGDGFLKMAGQLFTLEKVLGVVRKGVDLVVTSIKRMADQGDPEAKKLVSDFEALKKQLQTKLDTFVDHLIPALTNATYSATVLTDDLRNLWIVLESFVIGVDRARAKVAEMNVTVERTGNLAAHVERLGLEFNVLRNAAARALAQVQATALVIGIELTRQRNAVTKLAQGIIQDADKAASGAGDAAGRVTEIVEEEARRQAQASLRSGFTISQAHREMVKGIERNEKGLTPELQEEYRRRTEVAWQAALKIKDQNGEAAQQILEQEKQYQEEKTEILADTSLDEDQRQQRLQWLEQDNADAVGDIQENARIEEQIRQESLNRQIEQARAGGTAIGTAMNEGITPGIGEIIKQVEGMGITIDGVGRGVKSSFIGALGEPIQDAEDYKKKLDEITMTRQTEEVQDFKKALDDAAISAQNLSNIMNGIPGIGGGQSTPTHLSPPPASSLLPPQGKSLGGTGSGTQSSGGSSSGTQSVGGGISDRELARRVARKLKQVGHR